MGAALEASTRGCQVELVREAWLCGAAAPAHVLTPSRTLACLQSLADGPAQQTAAMALPELATLAENLHRSLQLLMPRELLRVA
jgi:hypothetical protein